MTDKQQLIERITRLVLEGWYPSPLMKDLSLAEMNPDDVHRAKRTADAIATAWLEDRQEAEQQANFKTMARVLLSLNQSVVITRIALEVDLDRYEIMTKPDSRLSGVEYILTKTKEDK